MKRWHLFLAILIVSILGKGAEVISRYPPGQNFEELPASVDKVFIILFFAVLLLLAVIATVLLIAFLIFIFQDLGIQKWFNKPLF